jgi:hypothetical protein
MTVLDEPNGKVSSSARTKLYPDYNSIVETKSGDVEELCM